MSSFDAVASALTEAVTALDAATAAQRQLDVGPGELRVLLAGLSRVCHRLEPLLDTAQDTAERLGSTAAQGLVANALPWLRRATDALIDAKKEAGRGR